MKKIQKQGIIFSLFLATNLFLFFYLNYTVVERSQMFISNRLYSTWNTVLQDSTLEVNDISDSLPNGSRIFFEHTDDGNIRTFYQNGNWTPPMIGGEFFHLDTNAPQAVVGMNVKNNLENEVYFTKGDIEYNIIGILGTSHPSPLDNLVLLNDMNNLLHIERIVVDTDSISDIEQVNQTFDVLSMNENQALERFLNSDVFHQLITINVIVISILLIAISGYVYFSLTKKADHVLYLLGNTNMKIFTDNISSLVITFMASFFVVWLVDLGVGNRVVLQYFLYYVFILLLIILAYCTNLYLHSKKGGVLLGD